jgi:hypothetical protein
MSQSSDSECETCEKHGEPLRHDGGAMCAGCLEDEKYGICELCKEEYPHEGLSPCIMGCCEGKCGREAVCSNCSDYNEERGEQLCYECNPDKGSDSDSSSESESESESESDSEASTENDDP